MDEFSKYFLSFGSFFKKTAEIQVMVQNWKKKEEWMDCSHSLSDNVF